VNAIITAAANVELMQEAVEWSRCFFTELPVATEGAKCILQIVKHLSRLLRSLTLLGEQELEKDGNEWTEHVLAQGNVFAFGFFTSTSKSCFLSLR